MIVSNGEAFIKLEIAAKAYFSSELYYRDPSVEHYEHLRSYLNLYVRISGICNIKKPAPHPIDRAFCVIPMRIDGMCKAQLINHRVDPDIGSPSHSKVELTTSNFTENLSPELIGCLVTPIDSYLNSDKYLDRSFVHLSEFINHSKQAGIEIDEHFLKKIIFDDGSFLRQHVELKPCSQLNFKQLANKYLKYINDIPNKVVVKAYQLASEEYFELKEDKQLHTLRVLFGDENIIQAAVSRNSNSDIINDDINNIYDLFKALTPSLSPTPENLDILKNAIPDAWHKMLFNTYESSTKVKNLDFDDDTPSKLYVAESLYRQVWDGFDPSTTNLPSKADVVKITKDLGITEPKDIEAVIRVSTPDGIVFGGHKSPDKINWMSLSERNTKRVII